MTESETIQRFTELLKSHPHAAAGILKDLCFNLGKTIRRNCDDSSIDLQIKTLRECFRVIDRGWPPECHAWDQVTHDFSCWLNGRIPRLQQAVAEITGWTDDKLSELKETFPRNIRALRDEYNDILASFPDWNT